MIKSLKQFVLLISLVHCMSLNAQDFVYDNNVYLDYIKSVKLSLAGLETSYPIVDLGSSFQGRMLLSFDDMEGGYKRYTYRIVHCNMYWEPSTEMEEIEYLDGFNGQDIEDYSYSTNGYSDYTHYRLILPNRDLKWTVSGNYLLIVYDDDLEIPVLTRRFMVAENKVNIGYQILKPRNVRKMDTHQEFKVTVSYKNFRISQPINELFVTVLQNGNWNTGKHNMRGEYERGEKLYFDQFDKISFPALKEFRNFDIRPLSYTTEFVNSIERDEVESTVLLDLGEIRSNRNFLDEIDANGFFILDNFRYQDAFVSSEYCRVIFSLAAEYPYDKELYIIGAFSDWQAKEEYKLSYDQIRQTYFGQSYFKQGYYDYLFALQNEDGTLDFQTIEGSWFETENDYQIIVYYRAFGSFYDRILAVKNFNSNRSN